MDPNTSHTPRPTRPVNPRTSDRWLSAVATPDGRPWVAVRNERGGASHIDLLSAARVGEPLQRLCEMPCGGAPERAALVVMGEGQPCLAWNEVLDGTWRIAFACEGGVGPASQLTPEIVNQPSTLCLAPALATCGDRPWLAWSQTVQRHLCIFLACRRANGPWDVTRVSTGAHHAFRPALAAGPRSLLLAWDQYRNGRYEVLWQVRALGGSLLGQGVLRHAGRHRLGPVVIAHHDGVFHLSLQERTDVADPTRDIHDHAIAVACVRVGADGKLLAPARKGGELLILADLRPGLLAAADDPYRSYDGLRRRPQLSVTADNRIWLCWEGRIPGGKGRDGHLLARPVPDGDEASVSLQADAAGVVHAGGVCYAVPPAADRPWAAFASSDIGDEPTFVTAGLDTEGRAPLNGRRWFREWEPISRSAQSTIPRGRQNAPDDLTLFWLDLHAHSNRSPDAEGEPDELLHYGRDVASLDGMAVVDNDYYPHKALAEAEWRSENAQADLYSEDGRFIVFPAYEFTYYDDALTPPLNHRTVIFRRTGGPLCRCTDPGSRTPDELVSRLAGLDALIVAHHCTWRTGRRDVDNVEVCSSWRVCMEEADFVERRLAAGERFGFMASSDSHRACPGLGGALTGVYAAELTREAIFDALRARRTVATQGQRVALHFTAGDLFIGEEGALPSSVPLRLHAAAPKPIEFAEVLRDNIVVKRVTRPGCDLAVDLDDTPGDGLHQYRVRLKTEGAPAFNVTTGDRRNYVPFLFTGPYASNLAAAAGPFAWSTPIWGHVGGAAGRTS